MTYIDYANRYWRVARANFASNNCAFLYFFLLDYVNGLRWQQPSRGLSLRLAGIVTSFKTADLVPAAYDVCVTHCYVVN